MRPLLLPVLLLLLSAVPAAAGTLVAARTIRAQSVIGPDDLVPGEATVAGALADPARAVGLEARVILHAGRPVRASDLGPPALVFRNAAVILAFRAGALTIRAEGRALGRAGEGETVRVLNLASRVTVTGRVAADGTVVVAGPPGVIP
ncbi:MAG: flagellar basal body P-ring formation protein FlgA [Rhodobacteraceae bacterium]|nr:flagellar basal body P-ring formation protein FlgA [Paracoccaceae bacterium]